MRLLSLATFLTVGAFLVSSQTEPECKCILNNLYLDVYLLVDISEQMGVTGLLEVASNVNSVFGYSQIRVGDHYADRRGARVGLVTYASQAQVLANLSDFQSAEQLTDVVYGLKPEDDGVSDLQMPLKVVQKLLDLTDGNAPRNNTKTVVIVYAADYVDLRQPSIAEIGNQLKSRGVVIITVADITRNDHQQIQRLAALASPGNAFNVNDDYPSEEVQQAMCRANCFCPPSYHQFTKTANGKEHAFGSCVRVEAEKMSWTTSKFHCQNLRKQGFLATEYTPEKHQFNQNLFENNAPQSKPSQYHVGLHFVNGAYFWEQAAGLPLVALSNPLYQLSTPPAATAQCVANTEDVETGDERWESVNCFNDARAVMCQVAACDTENFCA